MPRIGEPAPQFSLPTDDGGRVSLSDFAGKKVVLYFYPKDDTPGCTKEACDFRDGIGAFRGAGAEILGVSPDGAASHQEFKAKYSLPFTLLVDEDHAVSEAYGAWKEKTLYGRTFMGIERTTVLIDEQQKIAGVFNRVQVDGHAAHVLAVIKGEQPAPAPVEAAPAKPSARPDEGKKAGMSGGEKPDAPRPAKPKVAAKPAAKAKAPAAKKSLKKPAIKAAKVAKKASTKKKPAKKAAAKKPKMMAKKKTAKKASKTASKKKPAKKSKKR